MIKYTVAIVAELRHHTVNKREDGPRRRRKDMTMADRFFTQTTCDRCGKPLRGCRTMSMFNTDCICMECEAAERKRPDYEAAREAERAAMRAGDQNFKGIGF